MKQALEDKDKALVGAQKVAKEKAEAAEAKLASVGKLEEENASLKAAVEEVKKEATKLKKEQAEWAKKIEDRVSAFELEKTALNDKVDQLTQKRDVLEKYLGGFAKNMYNMLEGTFLCSRFTEIHSSKERYLQAWHTYFSQSLPNTSRAHPSSG
jgi:predicted RNase H-like nuclease (RuvC/YqgF family)